MLTWLKYTTLILLSLIAIHFILIEIYIYLGLEQALDLSWWVIPLLMEFYMTRFVVLCVAWAPFAALICAIISKKNGLSVWRFSLAGAILSVFLLLPWLYLIMRMSGKQIPRFIYVLSYLAVYCIWWMSSIAPLCFFFYFESTDLESTDLESSGFAFRLMFITGLITWMVSLFNLISMPLPGSLSDNHIRFASVQQTVYIAPFALTVFYSLSLALMYRVGWIFDEGLIRYALPSSALFILLFILYLWVLPPVLKRIRHRLNRHSEAI